MLTDSKYCSGWMGDRHFKTGNWLSAPLKHAIYSIEVVSEMKFKTPDLGICHPKRINIGHLRCLVWKHTLLMFTTHKIMRMRDGSKWEIWQFCHSTFNPTHALAPMLQYTQHMLFSKREILLLILNAQYPLQHLLHIKLNTDARTVNPSSELNAALKSPWTSYKFFGKRRKSSNCSCRSSTRRISDWCMLKIPRHREYSG